MRPFVMKLTVRECRTYSLAMPRRIRARWSCRPVFGIGFCDNGFLIACVFTCHRMSHCMNNLGPGKSIAIGNMKFISL